MSFYNFRKSLQQLTETVQDDEKLWDIVTALRGPDEFYLGKDIPIHDNITLSDSVVKQAVTGVIRHHIIKSDDFSMVHNPDCDYYVSVRKAFKDYVSYKSKYNHFHAHAQAAFKALGLKWDELNIG